MGDASCVAPRDDASRVNALGVGVGPLLADSSRILPEGRQAAPCFLAGMRKDSEGIQDAVWAGMHCGMQASRRGLSGASRCAESLTQRRSWWVAPSMLRECRSGNGLSSRFVACRTSGHRPIRPPMRSAQRQCTEVAPGGQPPRSVTCGLPGGPAASRFRVRVESWLRRLSS